MKQVILELDDAEHAALKARAAQNMRKIPQQLLFEALQFRRLAKSKPAARRKTKEAA